MPKVTHHVSKGAGTEIPMIHSKPSVNISYYYYFMMVIIKPRAISSIAHALDYFIIMVAKTREMNVSGHYPGLLEA